MHLILNIEQGGIYCLCIAIYIDKDQNIVKHWLSNLLDHVNI